MSALDTAVAFAAIAAGALFLGLLLTGYVIALIGAWIVETWRDLS